MIRKLKDSRGDFTINGVLILLLVIVLIILSISAIGVANQAMRVHNISSELARYIELRGRVDNAVYTELARMESVSGIDVDCQIEANYISGTTKIQFGAEFSVALSFRGEISLGGIVSIPIPLKSTVSGRGEQYWPS